MKMNAEDIQGILAKAVENAMGEDNTPNSNSQDDARFGSLEKSISKISAQVGALASAAAAGFEKPKTTEEIVGEFAKNINESIQNLGKTLKDDGKDKDDEAPIPATKGELAKMIGEVIQTTLKGKVDKGVPKGSGKNDIAPGSEESNDLNKTIAGLNDNDINSIVNSVLAKTDVQMSEELSREEEDAAGNPLSAMQKVKRAELDDHFGKVINRTEKRAIGEDDDDDEDDA